MLPLPGFATPLLYAVTAAVALLLVRRFVRPLSLGAALTLAALPSTIVAPALLTARVYGPVDLAYMGQPLWAYGEEHGVPELHGAAGGDVTFMMMPWRKAVRYELKHGRWPVWNRFILSGDVLAATQQSAPYHPLHVASYLLPLGPSFSYVAAGTLLLAALAGFLYARELVRFELAAIVAGAAWMLHAFLLWWLQYPLGLIVAGFPLVLLGARRTARDPGLGSALLLAVAFTLMLLAGHPESVVHVVAIGGLYGAVEAWRARGWRLLRPLSAAIVAGVLALSVSAVFVLPFLEALPETTEYQGRTTNYVREDRSVTVPETLRRLRVVVLPWVYGLPWREEAPPADPFFLPLSSAYVGSTLFPLVLFGLWRHPWRGRWPLFAAGVGGALAGASSPLVADVLAALPLFELAINKRLGFLAAFAFAGLAGLGADAWLRQEERERRTFGRIAFSSTAVVGGLALLLLVEWDDLRGAGLSARFLAEHTSLSLVPPLLVGLLLLPRWRPPAQLATVLLLLLAQRSLEQGQGYPTYSEAAFYPATPAIRTLQQEPGVFRVVGLETAVLPNVFTLWELEDVRGHQAMTLARETWTNPLWCTVPDHLVYTYVDDATRPFLSFLNVRFAVAPRGRPAPDGWSLFTRDRGVAIYENPRTVPRVFVPGEVWLDQPERRMRRQMAAETDFATRAWIEPFDSAAQGAAAMPTAPIANGPGRIDFERDGNTWRIDADMEGAGWVVASETAWPGWRARTAVGEDLPLAFANRAFVAFHLPAGRHRVELAYRPRSFVIGRALTFAGLTAGILMALLAWRGSRRR